MLQPPVRFAVGISDFRKLREGGYHYVDKTALVDAVVGEDAEVVLLPRPRRFGKTLNLSMLRCFLEKGDEDRRPLFAGLAVASSESARPHFQRYPVIFMTFKDVKPRSWEDCLAGMAEVLATTFGEHTYLLTEGTVVDAADAKVFTDIRERRAGRAQLVGALPLLSRLLARHHGEKVVILIDEYDSPIHAGYTHRYYDDVVAFFRDFLSGGLKDNPHLWKGVLTGILRVAKESLFSGLNNIAVYGILRSEYAPYFGFTEPEVRGLCDAVGRLELMDDIRAFYNGYLFGGVAMYNPWSVLCFLASHDKELLPYWIETSSNDLVRELLLTGPAGVRAELEALLAGGTVDKRIEENIVLRDVSTHPGAVWSFLLFTGYLKPVELRLVEAEREARLGVPNAEVAFALRKMTRDWIETQLGGSDALLALLSALLRGDAPVVERHLAHMLKVNLSYFDTAAPEPERFYHGLVVGLLAGLGSGYDVRSNRESGFGRCDVMVLPKTRGQPGVVLELKRVDTEAGETTEKAFTAAFRQLRERDYAAELRERGAAPIHPMAAVFEGKRVLVRAAVEKKARKAKTKRAAPAGGRR
jgi:Predicted AAA-ATPase/PD-(D/E)XK nuclease superfamily